ncbi:MAG: hypothetical protein JOZ37_15010 [Actinobacteria bacterium]|nr:hypothetical protein [Actinomycetota bacterium]MBV9254036.1 hypothetical protein [Actinomycetota bacterium]MBV9665275.1 hypothetical protein [Actinomycetota bacterium]MBV9936038.1 hypothetical protein [Actinomycetota bacterium]
MAVSSGEDRPRRALIEVTPDLVARLRDPRIVLAVVAAIGGGVALVAGYYGISGTLDPGKQLPYLISGGLGGLFLLGLAATLLFTAELASAKEAARTQRDAVDRLAVDVAELRDEVRAVLERLDRPARRTRGA